MTTDKKTILEKTFELSSGFSNKIKETVIILAAGHGKRIKSKKSKMLHKIWEVPTVERVYNSCIKGLDKTNAIVIVGIKALDVMDVIGKRENTLFRYQEKQNGTGHAVQVGIQEIDDDYDGIVYVLPGDMGLIDDTTIAGFRNGFQNDKNSMLVLTGLYEGDPSDNYYGRIIRVRKQDTKGQDSGEDYHKVIEIMEHKEIQALEDNSKYITEFRGREYSFTKDELLNNNEYNSGVFAFKYKYLKELIKRLDSDNAQNEVYITDLISIFNSEGLSIRAISPLKQHVLMGFNNKSVLHQMDSVARGLVYEQLKNIIEIYDPEDFFIHETVVDSIIKMDKEGIPLDITLGKGVYIGKGAKLNYNLELKKNIRISGHVEFGKNVSVGEGVELSCFPGQTLQIEDNVDILRGNMIRGNIVIGEGSEIESGVKLTGSDPFPLRIGKNVVIRGRSYIFGSTIEDEIFIEHSVIIKKKVERLIKKNGRLQSIRFYLPMPEGIDAIEELC